MDDFLKKCFFLFTTRKSLLIFAIITSAVIFIYGIATLATFGSNTEIYEVLIWMIDNIEESGSNPFYPDLSGYSGYSGIFSDYDFPEFETDKDSADDKSLTKIMNFKKKYLNSKSYGLVKSLDGIEKGLGSLLFIFNILLLAASIVYLIFAWGIKEKQLLPTNTFNIFNIAKLVTLIISLIFIILSLLYGILLSAAVSQYKSLLDNIDSCADGIIVGIVYGFLSFLYYISLAWAFAQEHRLFREVGSVDKPGVLAEYDVSGNPIGREARDVIVQQAGEENPQLVGQKMVTSTNQPYQQVQNINQFGQEIPAGIPNVYQQPQQKPIITQKPAEKPLTQEQILQQQQQQMLQQQQQQQGILQQQQLIQGKTMEQTSDRNLLNNNQSNNINNK